jgi:4'-phosphopantetheinyl transferase
MASMKHWPQPPPRDGIHLWICKDLHAPHLDSVIDILAPEEQKRARAYRFENDRQRYLGSALLQRSVLAHYTSSSLQDLSFSRNQWGKPYLDRDHHEIEFNISRSHDVALLAISSGSKLGVDVEYSLGCNSGAISVAKQFSKPEQKYIATASNSTEALFEIWSRKEAYIKGIGRGLSHPLNKFDVTPPGKAIVRDWSENPPAERWSVHSIKIPESGYAAAIATVLPSPSIKLIEVTINDLRPL